ncbi:MAG: 1-acyl-sn-glycerol-3-phosphate acyltransferase [Cytophagales bacterium]|nr:1-acyl-sn-glycerol-3-phosphate acyltransferase [Armatimonadota bacterium]
MLERRTEQEVDAMLYRMTWPLMKLFMRTAFGVLGGFRRSGVSNVPARGGVLLCPNHFSDADPAAVAVALPRNAWFMAKAELFEVPVLGALMRLWHGFPVKRDSADRSALRRAEELLKAGEVVVIFPEGGGNPHGLLQPLHPGALMVALRAKVPVVPVALVNTSEIWTYGAPLPRRSGIPVLVTFGPALDLSDLEGQRGAIEKATARLTETLATMLQQPVPVGSPKRRTDGSDEEALPGSQFSSKASAIR